MIKDRKIAQAVNDLMLEYASKLDSSVILVMNNSSHEEFSNYKSVVGKIMGEMLLEIMNPIYKEHPDLKPPELE